MTRYLMELLHAVEGLRAETEQCLVARPGLG